MLSKVRLSIKQISVSLFGMGFYLGWIVCSGFLAPVDAFGDPEMAGIIAVLFTSAVFCLHRLVGMPTAFSWLGGGLVSVAVLISGLFRFSHFDLRLLSRCTLPLMTGGIFLE